MATLSIDQHLIILCKKANISEEEFIELISNRFDNAEKRQIRGWLDGKKAQRKTVISLCKSISQLAGTGTGEKRDVSIPGHWPQKMESMDVEWFSFSVSRFIDSCGFDHKSNDTIQFLIGDNTSIQTDDAYVTEDSIENFYALIRKVRPNNSNPTSVVIELLYIGTQNGSGFRSNIITRIGQHHKGISLVSPHNVYSIFIRKENSSSEQFSARFLNFNKPVRGSNNIMGGFLQRSTNSNSDPASYVAVAIKLSNLSLFKTYSNSLTKILKELILNEEYISDVSLDEINVPFVRTINEKNESTLFYDIIERLNSIVDSDDIAMSAEDLPLGFKIASPEIVTKSWANFDIL